MEALLSFDTWWTKDWEPPGHSCWEDIRVSGQTPDVWCEVNVCAVKITEEDSLTEAYAVFKTMT